MGAGDSTRHRAGDIHLGLFLLFCHVYLYMLQKYPGAGGLLFVNGHPPRPNLSQLKDSGTS